MPFSEPQMQAAATGRIAPARAVAPAGAASVDPSDWESIRRALSGIAADTPQPVAVAWHNVGTGSDGTVTVGPAGKTSAGLCRPFTTTLNAPRGVRSYRGEACRSGKGDWTLARVFAEDSA
ncbi:MAG TPA: RT0821/Lpp0805 family surface protein [Bauldia sp.]|nr:RT0821/Lpp0805 family surface protein [Bauldia sp.]